MLSLIKVICNLSSIATVVHTCKLGFITIQGFDWENFGVLDRCGCLREVVAHGVSTVCFLLHSGAHVLWMNFIFLKICIVLCLVL